MQPKNIDAYVAEVGKKIRWEKARTDVMKELHEHISDLREMYITQGMGEETATHTALAQMGDAVALGKELNRANRPAPEWARQNVFIKATLRQGVRTFLLFALVLIASFAFVLRNTEFAIIRASIFEAAGFYRSVGFLVPADDRMYADASHVADMLSRNRLVGFEDRRSGAQGILVDIPNHDIAHNAFTRHGEEFFQYSTYVAYFYAMVERVRPRLVLEVEDVIVGFPEHALAGQRMNVDIIDDIPLTLEAGERYLFAASFHQRIGQLPEAGLQFDGMFLRPLAENVWYIHAPHGELDFTQPALAGLAEDIALSKIKHHTVHVRTTRDMTAMPEVHEVANQIRLIEGRWLNYDDYLAARPVAVIQHRFARQRNIAEGDTITIEIPSGQRAVAPNRYGFISAAIVTDEHSPSGTRILEQRTDFFMDYRVEGDTTTPPLTLELTVVGFHSILPLIPLRDMTPFDSYIFIPDSLLLADYRPTHAVYAHFLPDFWYSFHLRDTRHESRFLVNYRSMLLAEGFEVALIPSGAENFWLSAEPTLRTATINLALFWAVMLLVFSIVTYIFLLQRRKDFAILRALGQSVKTCGTKLQYTLIIFFLPAVFVGGISGWFVALNEAAKTVSYVLIEAEAIQAAALPLYILFLQLCIAWFILVIITYMGVRNIAKRPALELLQWRGK
ncbi:MAG: ABC transporter permease [Defluviitaleaceae bacterium]|nr:ABC transporter permease [Defluviitaleaceae bacterium]MCL2275628.1 ABC transporter permease [Defluviitaleaceae bacterium]